MEILWNRIARGEWDRITDRVEAGLQQRWSYGEAVQAHGAGVARVAICKQNRTLGIAQIVTRRFGGVITRGPLWVDGTENPTAMHALRNEFRNRGVRICAVTPPRTQNRVGLPIMTPATLAYLPIHPPDRGAMHSKWRNRLLMAENAGVTISRLPNQIEKLEWLLQADRVQQKARGYRALPGSFTAAWLANDTSNALTLTAGRNNRPIAAMMFLLHGNTATYHIGWSDDQGRAANAHNLLLWQAAKRLAAKGVRKVDLGTLDTVNTPGLARFKLGSGAKPCRLGPTSLVF